jgi:inosose dehydratase
MRITRRNFAQSILGAAAVPALWSAESKNIKIGYTALTWNAGPRTPENLESALKDMSELGFYSFETFAEVLETLDTQGTLAGLIEKYKLPLTSAYFTVNVIDPAQRKDNLEKAVRLAKVIKKNKGTFMVIAPNGVKRQEYQFGEHRDNIVAALNEYAKAITDVGLTTGLHQHTGTAVETRDETYYVMEHADTKYLKFAPDVGQLQKGGADAAKVVKDFLPILRHMHLKDFVGGQYFAGYCPLGQGKVDIAGILDTLEKNGKPVNVMVELDRSPSTPITARETADTTKAYLVKLGYKLRT